MRKKLEKIQNIRKTFVGIFERFGNKTNWHGFPEATILLVDVKDLNGKKVTGHIWFNLTKGFQKICPLKEGDKIQFDARVKDYIKGYAGYKEEIQQERPLEIDYKLNNPTKINKIGD